MRLSHPTLRVLKYMLDSPNEPYYGYELLQRVGIPAGSLYPILARLEGAGWIVGEWEQVDPQAAGRPARRYYRLTPPGAVAADASLRELQREPVRSGRTSAFPWETKNV